MNPGYKQSDIGVIPEDWEVRTLGSLTTLLTNGFVGTATTAYVESDDGVLYIQGYNVQENGFNFHGIKRVSKEFHARNKKSCLQAGDLLTIQTGDIGVTTVVPPELAGANCHALIISRLRKQDSEPGYYCQYFNSERGRVAFKEIETGTTMKHLNGGDMKRLFLPFPPIEEQRAIATALSDMDGLLGGLDRLIAKKRDLKQAAMQQLLTGQTRLPGFHGEWEVKTIDQVGFVTSGKRLPLGCSLVEQPTPHPYVRVADMRPGTVDLSEIKYVPENVFPAISRYRIFCDDVFISVAGSLGIVGKVPRELDGANLTENADRITNITCSQDFLLHVLMSPLIQKTIDSIRTVGAQPKLALTRIRKFVIPYPPLPEQTAIAEVLTEMDAELAGLEQRREKTRALKQGMMQELLTGKTRLLAP